MLKILLAATAAVLLTPALAHGATNPAKIRGTVAVKQANRHVLVIATRGGRVESARVSTRQLRKTRVGERLALTGTRLADGSLHVTALRRLGSAKRAKLSVVILKAKGRRLLVAGGGSAFSIRLTRGTRLLAGAASVHAGQAVKADVELSDGGPVGTKVEDNGGDASLVDFSGDVTAIDATSITVENDGVTTVVQLPDGFSLPTAVRVGSEVEIVASVNGSTLTLTSIKLDGENPGDDGGSDVSDGKVKVEGFVTALDTVAGSVTVQPGDNASPVTFAIPDGFTLPDGLAVGTVVEARGEMVDNVLTLTEIELKSENGDSEIEAEGTVTALDTVAGSITIQTSGGGDDSGDDEGDPGSPSTFTFAIPTGFTLPDGVAVGSAVKARGDMVDGVLTLTRLRLDDDGSDG
jgi:hypothetical protein